MPVRTPNGTLIPDDPDSNNDHGECYPPAAVKRPASTLDGFAFPPSSQFLPQQHTRNLSRGRQPFRNSQGSACSRALSTITEEAEPMHGICKPRISSIPPPGWRIAEAGTKVRTSPPVLELTRQALQVDNNARCTRLPAPTRRARNPHALLLEPSGDDAQPRNEQAFFRGKTRDPKSPCKGYGVCFPLRYVFWTAPRLRNLQRSRHASLESLCESSRTVFLSPVVLSVALSVARFVPVGCTYV